MIIELRGTKPSTMKHPKLFLSASLLFISIIANAQAPNRIWAYAIGDWRNGPVVTISPLFETTEAFTTIQLINRVKKDYAEFAHIDDIDVQRFATTEEGDLSRTTLKGKYEVRKLKVNLMTAPAAPEPKADPMKAQEPMK